jgi:hypothetical protein
MDICIGVSKSIVIAAVVVIVAIGDLLSML